MALSTLVVSCDPAILQRVIPVFDLAGIDTEVCTLATDAERKLACRRYDATLIDCTSLPGAREVLDGVHRGSNRSAVTFAIVSEITSPRDAAALGASFVLEKSFTQDWLLRSLRAAQGLMVVENRRYYRLNVDFVAWVQRPTDRGNEKAITVTDISQGGIGAHTPLAFEPNVTVELRFTLPGDAAPIDAQAQAAWCSQGRVGLQFTRMSTKSKARMVAWLMAQYDKTQPSVPAIPASMNTAAPEPPARRGRKLLCHAFAQNLPIAWKCNDCGWRYSIRMQDSLWRYANEPPQEVVLAFEGHDCAHHPKNGVVFGK